MRAPRAQVAVPGQARMRVASGRRCVRLPVAERVSRPHHKSFARGAPSPIGWAHRPSGKMGISCVEVMASSSAARATTRSPRATTPRDRANSTPLPGATGAPGRCAAMRPHAWARTGATRGGSGSDDAAPAEHACRAGAGQQRAPRMAAWAELIAAPAAEKRAQAPTLNVRGAQTRVDRRAGCRAAPRARANADRAQPLGRHALSTHAAVAPRIIQRSCRRCCPEPPAIRLQRLQAAPEARCRSEASPSALMRREQLARAAPRDPSGAARAANRELVRPTVALGSWRQRPACAAATAAAWREARAPCTAHSQACSCRSPPAHTAAVSDAAVAGAKQVTRQQAARLLLPLRHTASCARLRLCRGCVVDSGSASNLGWRHVRQVEVAACVQRPLCWPCFCISHGVVRHRSIESAGRIASGARGFEKDVPDVRIARSLAATTQARSTRATD